MTGPDLAGATVLVLEDDYYLASDLEEALAAAGATVVGPFADEASARRALDEALPGCAIVDVNLGQGPSFALPRALAARAVPFAFVTGYDRAVIPSEFAGAERMEKPVSQPDVVRAAARMLQG